MSNIKNVIFDLGGVLLNIDYHLTAEAFKKLGVLDFDDVYSQAKQSNLFNKLEVGEISEEEFCEGIRMLAKIDHSDELIKEAWNAMLLDFPQERFEFLKKVGAKYNIYLLSNTNAIHLEAFSKIIKSENDVDLLDSYFEKAYYSHIIGRRKPNSSTFQYVLEQNDLIAAETLFIDDSPQHLVGAQETGISTCFLDTENEDVISKLEFLLA